MHKRIYVVSVEDKEHLVKAASVSAAIRAVAHPMFKAAVATQDDLDGAAEIGRRGAELLLHLLDSLSEAALLFSQILEHVGAICRAVAEPLVGTRTANRRMMRPQEPTDAQHRSDATGDRRRRPANHPHRGV